MDIDDIIRHIERESDTVKQGRLFERVIQRILDNRLDYKRVLLWSQFSKEYIFRPDEGIDIMCENHDGTWDAVQCKFHGTSNTLSHEGISKFNSLVSSINKNNPTITISDRILVHTADKISSAGNYKLADAQVWSLDTLRGFNIKWDSIDKIKPRKPYKLRPYQKSAVQDVIDGFSKQDRIDKRGRLIMACGTGKTLTALHITEQLVKPGSIVLYLVPSISLIQQGLIDWSNNYNIQQRYTAICSDDDVDDDIPRNELGTKVTTNPDEIKRFIKDRDKQAINVIFCTYQSLDKLITATKDYTFSLAISDEAHRTTGSIQKKQFNLIHDNDIIKCGYRLYMTATPKVYGKDLEHVYSMDDEKIYGPELHKLGFYKAVEMGILADFRVKMVEIPEHLNNELKERMTTDAQDKHLKWYAKLHALWHGLNYPNDFRLNLLQRVIVFTNRVKDSKKFAGDKKIEHKSFEKMNKKEFNGNTVQVRHIDGSTPIRHRREYLRWLKSSEHDKNECRIISNARVLGEGVDVPALDGVVFLDPKTSQVDIIQALGRVMRKAPGKDIGYVILPVVTQKGRNDDDTLSSSDYKILWQVLKALQSHDENFTIEINQLILDSDDKPRSDITDRVSIVRLNEDLEEFDINQPYFAELKTRLVNSCINKKYYDDYGEHIGKTSLVLQDHINKEYKTDNNIKLIIDNLHKNLKKLLHDKINIQTSINTLCYHIVLSPIFRGLFDNDINFVDSNPIAKAFESTSRILRLDYDTVGNRIKMIDNDIIQDDKLTKLYQYYKELRKEISAIGDDNTKKQNFIIKIYDNFFEGAAKKDAEKHGIVYTPLEIVDFIIHSIQHVLKTEFDKDFADDCVKILDPFTGTGSFIVQLIKSGYLDSNLTKKYKEDLYANELMLLAYYVATVNIENVFTDTCKGHKQIPFTGINYTDTFNLPTNSNLKRDKKIDNPQFRSMQERTIRQSKVELDVIMGNPPYSAKQDKKSNMNENIKYDKLDQRIKETYVKKSTNVNNTIYDSYIRSIRWATDRIVESGVIGFVTNGSFIKSNTGSGVRAALHEEFTDIYCFDLRGNQRTQGEISKKEGGKIFGSGSRAPVAITILVKNPNKKQHTIHYKDIGDYLSREDKLKTIHDYTSIQGIKDWQTITPDKHHDWLGQRSDEFERYVAMGSKETKAGKASDSIFKLYSNGVKTARDAWAYNSLRKELIRNMNCTIKYANKQNLNDKHVIEKSDKTKIQWASDTLDKLKKSKSMFDENKVRIALYRPFFKQYLYFDKTYNQMIAYIPKIFPNNNSKNIVIVIPYKYNTHPSVFIINITPDLSVLTGDQCFPIYTYTAPKLGTTHTHTHTHQTLKKKTSQIMHSNNTTISTKIHQSPKKIYFITFMAYYTMKDTNPNSKTTYKKSYPEYQWHPTLKHIVQPVENSPICTSIMKPVKNMTLNQLQSLVT